MSEERTCETCRYFHVHFIPWSGTNFHPVASGHCGKPRIRLRFAHAGACPRYEARDPIPASYLL